MKNLVLFSFLCLSLFLISCTTDSVAEENEALLLEDDFYLNCCTDVGQWPAEPYEDDEE